MTKLEKAIKAGNVARKANTQHYDTAQIFINDVVFAKITEEIAKSRNNWRVLFEFKDIEDYFHVPIENVLPALLEASIDEGLQCEKLFREKLIQFTWRK